MKISLLSWQISFSLFLIFLSMSTHSTPTQTQVPCLSSQKSLLLELRTSLNYTQSSSSKLANWDQEGSDCCLWRGVTCNASTGDLIGLDLSSELIRGGIDSSSTLFALQFLQSLNLANNSFANASIPDGIEHLTRLTHLNLSNAGFGGQVPSALSGLRNLVVLDLSSLPYYGSTSLRLENPDLRTLVRSLTAISELHLDGVEISARGSEWCGALSSSLPNLRVLSLSNCNLSDGIDGSLAKMKLLSVLRLDQNNLSAQVPDFVARFQHLTTLTLSSCGLIGAFPQGIFKVPTLQKLDLSTNTQLQGTLPEFPESGALQELVLQKTNFSGELPDSIGNLKGLQKLVLSNCNFGGGIPSSMANLSQLVYVDLQGNKFSGPFLSSVSAKNLTWLVLSGNNLSGSIDSVNWESLSNLVNLDLSNNSFHGSIPMSLFSIQSLQKLQLRQNGFDGQLSQLNVSSQAMDTIDLRQNNLEGEISESFFRLPGLKSLRLSFNKFSGTLKLNMIQKLESLSVLDLSYNNLSIDASNTSLDLSSFPQLTTLCLASCNLHELPDFLKNQSKMQYLDLSNNVMGGRVPGWILEVGNGFLNSLNLSCNNFVSMEQHLLKVPLETTFLDLHSNNLQGQLPSFPLRATYLDFSNNSFNSTIRAHISPFTVFLSVSRNNITGSIPKSLCNATSLEFLDLSNNQLNGTIPSCVERLGRRLRVLNLGGNSLSGAVAEIFSAGCVLETLDFHGNSLEGLVPRSLANCTKLEVLNLGRNQLNDTFPCWLTNSSCLRVLVLRSNQFHGNISCLRNNEMWPLLQIVDLALNHFDGQLLPEYFSKWPAMMIDSDRATSLQYPILSFDRPIYYQNTIMVTFKGSEFELLKILTLFSCLDFSNNSFNGEIPAAVANLNGLIVLNFSHNALSGHIPSSIGKLGQLESLDLSYNQLSGEIPEDLSRLTFLSFLSVAFNRLVGKIPTGSQLVTFPESSFQGNEGLCGSPLPDQCIDSNGTLTATPPSPSDPKAESSGGMAGFDWQFILPGVGFGLGFGLVVAPFTLWRKARRWYNEQVDILVCIILSWFGIIYTGLDGRETGEDVGNQSSEIAYYDKDDEDETEDEQGSRFCVFCSKLDPEVKEVIHNPRCTCHGSPTISSSSWSSLSVK